MSRRVRTGTRKRSNAVYIIPILIVVTGIVGYYIFTQSGTVGGSSPLVGQQVSATVLNDLSGVSMSTLNQIGKASSVNSPTTLSSGSPLTLNGKPEILYMGAEYCPYCAAERWAMVVALDKFGNFTGIQYMQSSSTDVYPNTSTFTFVGATYTSKYVTLVTVEQADRNNQPLQSATTEETSLLTTYDTGGTIPFIDIGNTYAITSSQFLPSALRVGDSSTGAAYNWTQISSRLNNASSIPALNVDGAANRLISAICKIDGGAPASVCSQGAAQTLGYTRTPPSGGSQLLVSDILLGGTRSSAETARLTPSRSAQQI